MFWISLIVTILYFLECYSLFKKNLKKSCLRVVCITIGFIIVNVLMLYGSLKVQYSSILYLLDCLNNNLVVMILGILINFGLYFYLIKLLIKLRKKKKQNKKLFISILGMGFIYNFMLFFILFYDLMVYVLLIGLIGSIVLLIKSYVKDRHNYVLIILIVLGLFTYYSYFTYGGAARLQIAMMGYPFSAYDTGLEELSHLKEKNVKQFYPIKSIKVESGDMGIIVVHNYLGIKIGKYVGF